MSNTNGRTLVAYFSATGTTERLALTVARVADADLHRIEPAEPYTAADLDWNDRTSRSSVEMADPASRPAIAGGVKDMDGYDTLLIGFPIWWYVAPRIVNTFLESYDLSGKRISAFATSGGSGLGKTVDMLRPSAPDARWLPGRRFDAAATDEQVRLWLEDLER